MVCAVSAAGVFCVHAQTPCVCVHVLTWVY